jgi:hypothetical protein
LQFARAVSALVERHAAGEYTLDNAWLEESPFGRSQTLRSERLRQPAPTRPFGKSQTPKNRGLRQPAGLKAGAARFRDGYPLTH